jgi:hypothetical protein
MQQVIKVKLFLREGKFAARAQRVPNPPSKKRYFTNKLQVAKFENFLLCEPVDL